MSQSPFLAITRKLLTSREKSRALAAIGVGFASHWLKKKIGAWFFSQSLSVIIAIA